MVPVPSCDSTTERERERERERGRIEETLNSDFIFLCLLLQRKSRRAVQVEFRAVDPVLKMKDDDEFVVNC